MPSKITLIEVQLDEFIQLITDAVAQLLFSIEEGKHEDKLLTLKQTAELFQVTLPTIYKYIEEGKIIRYEVGKSPRFKKSELLEALKVIRQFKK